MMLNLENFEEVRAKGEEFYKSIGEVHCPYFKEKISFGAQGLEHLKFKRREKARLEQDQYMRLKLLHLAPEILKSSHTLQGILETKKFERVRMHSRTDTVLKLVSYYEFISAREERVDEYSRTQRPSEDEIQVNTARLCLANVRA